MPDERMRVERADITKLAVDAVVNAANQSLRGGGGVDGAIHYNAGPKLLQACIEIGSCPRGEARITPGFDLPARYVIHTVGPAWHGGDRGEAELLAKCYRNSFALAVDHGVRSIAFPAISCGAFSYPVLPATEIAVREVRAFLETDTSVDCVTFACREKSIVAAYKKILAR